MTWPEYTTTGDPSATNHETGCSCAGHLGGDRLAERREQDQALAHVVTLTDGDTITSPMLPGFDLPVAGLLEPEP